MIDCISLGVGVGLPDFEVVTEQRRGALVEANEGLSRSTAAGSSRLDTGAFLTLSASAPVAISKEASHAVISE